MRKEEWGWATVGSLLLSFVFPPYFIAFLAISSLGGLGFLLKSLTPAERELLVRFEKEFRKGYKLELAGNPEQAIAHYRSLAEKYPKFDDIIAKRIDWVDKHPEGSAETPLPDLSSTDNPPDGPPDPKNV